MVADTRPLQSKERRRPRAQPIWSVASSTPPILSGRNLCSDQYPTANGICRKLTACRRGQIPLLAEEGWREAPGWSVRPKCAAGLTTPSAPSLRSAHPPLLCEEGNRNLLTTHSFPRFLSFSLRRP